VDIHINGEYSGIMNVEEALQYLNTLEEDKTDKSKVKKKEEDECTSTK
jgi:hypothetical protein